MKKRTSVLLLILCAALLLSGCGEEEERPNDMKLPHETATYVYPSGILEDKLTTDLDPAFLLLVNKTHVLSAGYVPSDLVTLTCTTAGGKSIQLDRTAAEALYQMMSAMYAAGITDNMVTSAYRDYDYQQYLFYERYVPMEMATISQEAIACLGLPYIQSVYGGLGGRLTRDDAEKVVATYSARPGQSEHQSGLCVDFITSTMTALDLSYENTAAFRWLSEHAYQYGFILRFPEGKEAVTGYSYEPWHYRFVGREAATDIHLGGLTLEEYLGQR